MREILIPTDFSENAMNAIKFALEFFKYERGNFYFMHTYQDEVYALNEQESHENFKDILSKVKSKSQKSLEKLVAHVKQLSPHPRFQYQIISSYNSLIEEVDLISDAKNIDVIVMGTKGFSNKESTYFGSNTLHVLKYVHCPVLCIPARFEYKPPKRFLFPTDYLIPYKRRELKLLCEMAHPFRANISVLFISRAGRLSRRQEDNKAFLESELNKNKLDFKHLPGKDIVKVIFDYILAENIDLLVLVNTRHSYLENMLFGSTLDRLSLNLNIPMLVLQNTFRVASN